MALLEIILGNYPSSNLHTPILSLYSWDAKLTPIFSGKTEGLPTPLVAKPDVRISVLPKIQAAALHSGSEKTVGKEEQKSREVIFFF